MEKLRAICKSFWKKSYIIIPIMLVVFFILGYAHEYLDLMGLSDEQVQLYYSELTKKMIFEFSIESGFVWAIFYTIVIVYIVFLLTMLISKDAMYRMVGVTVLVFSIIGIAWWFWIWNRFTIPI